VCRFAEAAPETELAGVREAVPKDLLGFWRETREAELFVDFPYGQWGDRPQVTTH
jgi:hypothetical protein